MSTLVWALLSGAVSYRVWRMVAHDTLFDDLRERLPQDGFWADLWSCPWCLGFWLNVAFAGVLVGVGSVDVWNGMIVVLAGSTVTGLIARGD